uniref:IS66 family transposase n=1 Tax=Yunchengibacter salinarum TaxID=3133399 RepID=UPI0035B61048
MDETPFLVLTPGREKTKSGYLWVLAWDDPAMIRRGWSSSMPLAAVAKTPR